MRRAWLPFLVVGIGLAVAAVALAFGETYHVGKAFAERALLEVKLVGLINKDLANAQNNIVDWKLRQEIRRTAIKLETAE